MCSAKTQAQQNDPRILVCRVNWDFCCQRNRWRPGTRHSEGLSGGLCWPSAGASCLSSQHPDHSGTRQTWARSELEVQVLSTMETISWFGDLESLLCVIAARMSFTEEMCCYSHFIQQKTEAWKTSYTGSVTRGWFFLCFSLSLQQH